MGGYGGKPWFPSVGSTGPPRGARLRTETLVSLCWFTGPPRRARLRRETFGSLCSSTGGLTTRGARRKPAVSPALDTAAAPRAAYSRGGLNSTPALAAHFI